MSTPAAHPQVPKPRVPISRKNTTTYIARCHHCPWEKEDSVRAALEEQCRYHRHQHATGQIPTT